MKFFLLLESACQTSFVSLSLLTFESTNHVAIVVHKLVKEGQELHFANASAMCMRLGEWLVNGIAEINSQS